MPKRRGNGRPKRFAVQLMTLLDESLATRLQAMADHFDGPRAKLVRGLLEWHVDRFEREHAPGGKGCTKCRGANAQR